jgi:predicted nucleotidyltransferase component of viral defense system
MLHLKTVHPETLELLKQLSRQECLEDFVLGGGTALALHLGHRISIDLDFFTRTVFDSNEKFECLRSSYAISNCERTVNSLSLLMTIGTEAIKIDLLRHNYSLLRPIQVLNDFRIFALEDIGAMKLNAIANRGAKKDFYDIHALLKCFSLPELLTFFQQKYEQLNSFTVIKSLVYFTDADQEPDPVSLMNTGWEQIKNDLQEQVHNIE